MDNNIELAKDTISKEDILSLQEWLGTNPRLTKGEKTLEFEKKFAEYIGHKYAVYVNSGSSANLLMYYSLIRSGMLKNKKICVPNISWITTIAPAIQFGLQPILIDCNLDDLSVDIEQLEKEFKEEKPAALILVSVLGLPPMMDKIKELCYLYDVLLIEDACEALGSAYKNKKIGSWGLMSSFSFYYGHHISTIEGGMVCTSNEDLYHLLLMLRSHGWDRDLPIYKKHELMMTLSKNDFDSIYTFYEPGFNLRSTDLQAHIGLSQMAKLNWFCDSRQHNYILYRTHINCEWRPFKSISRFDEYFISNMGYPIIFDNPHKKYKAIYELREKGVQCRPIISGAMGKQPFFKRSVGYSVTLPNSSIVDSCGIYVPNHAYLTSKDIELIYTIINKADE